MAHPDSASLPRDLRYGERREREYTRLIDCLGEVSSPSEDVQCGCHPGLSRPNSGVWAFGRRNLVGFPPAADAYRDVRIFLGDPAAAGWSPSR